VSGERPADVGALRRLAVQPGWLPGADDVDEGVAAIGDAVGDGVGLAVELDATGLVFELVAEQAKQGGDPEVAGLGGERGQGSPIRYSRLATRYLPLEDAPVVLRIGPGAGDLVLDLAATIQPEVGGALAGGVVQTFQDVRREDGTFDADVRVVHWDESDPSRKLSRMACTKAVAWATAHSAWVCSTASP